MASKLQPTRDSPPLGSGLGTNRSKVEAASPGSNVGETGLDRPAAKTRGGEAGLVDQSGFAACDGGAKSVQHVNRTNRPGRRLVQDILQLVLRNVATYGLEVREREESKPAGFQYPAELSECDRHLVGMERLHVVREPS